MKFIKQFFLVLALICAPAALAAPVGGEEYTVVKPPQPTQTGKKIEVLEFFFYGCQHCFKLHELLGPWEMKMPKDVELVLVPAVFNPSWEPMARTFYALESLGQQKQLHEELYKAWHMDNIALNDEAKITEFVVQHGVDRKKFSDAYHAFSMEGKILRSKQMAQTFGIRGTPTVIVDGKYMISALQPADTMRVLDAMIVKARKERGGNKGNTKNPN